LPANTSASVLAALEDQGLGGQLFPVYTFSADSGHDSACVDLCAVVWPPVLTDGHADAMAPLSSNQAGIIVRRDGTHQVTVNGHPLYLFRKDAGLAGTPAPVGVANGSGVNAFGGTFNLVPTP